ncbi:HAD-IA family hydrolase [Gloeobacter kilaueensis]|uniref:Phosphoglycolate phosphatase n=1 Tax=Gloeobacter kilaueensis (strain ATCC BAA-2537 / CCAP 1431/1 / ULC 316 / JS1) TaxID=1183438 RepID=U5QLN4_GLOK1|nr:HAD-IA family hydrolase [Gloeobacter kilaueensis]AGY59882.1 phosphoglycolate phosphatase [Gloeobacter kilaueensis JS1]
MKAVLFDAVGTLFAVRGSVGAIYSEQARPFGIEVDPLTIEKRFRQAFAARRAPAADARQWWHQLLVQIFADTNFPEFERYFEQVWHYFATAAAWQLFPETAHVLKVLRERHLRLAVVSNFDERLYPVLRALDLASYFEAVAISTEVGFAKPDPRLFVYALQQLGCTADEAVHVGDSPEDVIGAEAAGIRAFKVVRDAEPEADAISSLTQLMERF